MSASTEPFVRGTYKEGFHDDLKTLRSSRKGATHDVIDYMCDVKGEPDWMRQFRHRSLDIFLKKELPAWLPGLRDEIAYDEITFYASPVEKSANRSAAWARRSTARWPITTSRNRCRRRVSSSSVAMKA
jgi:hypothetical protein